MREGGKPIRREGEEDLREEGQGTKEEENRMETNSKGSRMEGRKSRAAGQ